MDEDSGEIEAETGDQREGEGRDEKRAENSAVRYIYIYIYGHTQREIERARGRG